MNSKWPQHICHTNFWLICNIASSTFGFQTLTFSPTYGVFLIPSFTKCTVRIFFLFVCFCVCECVCTIWNQIFAAVKVFVVVVVIRCDYLYLVSLFFHFFIFLFACSVLPVYMCYMYSTVYNTTNHHINQIDAHTHTHTITRKTKQKKTKTSMDLSNSRMVTFE